MRTQHMHFAALVMTLSLGVVPLTAQEKNSVPGPSSPSTTISTEMDVRRGLVLEMTFDSNETGTGKITDVSGNGNHGRPSGVRWTATGKRGGAYEFSTDGDEIVVPNSASLNPSQFTLSAWVKTAFRDQKWRRIFDKSYSRGYALSIAADWNNNQWSGLGSLEIGPGAHFNLTRTMVADGAWHHIVATFDGREQLLFLDGKPSGPPLRWDSTGRVGATAFDLLIGCNRSNIGEDDFGVSFRGTIDEPMMWDRALSVREVALLYRSQQ